MIDLRPREQCEAPSPRWHGGKTSSSWKSADGLANRVDEPLGVAALFDKGERARSCRALAEPAFDADRDGWNPKFAGEPVEQAQDAGLDDCSTAHG